MTTASTSDPEQLEIFKLVQQFIDGSLRPEEAARVASAIKADLIKFKDMTEKYLSGSVEGKQLDDFREGLIDNGSPAESYLERKPGLWKVYDPFIEELSLYEPDPMKRAEGDSLIGDEELKNSAKAFLDALNITIDKL